MKQSASRPSFLRHTSVWAPLCGDEASSSTPPPSSAPHPNWQPIRYRARQSSASWPGRRRWQALAKRSPDEEHDDDVTRSAAENLDRAYYFYERQRHARSADLFNRALEQDPGLIGDSTNQHRYNAACASLLAAASPGKNEPAQKDSDRIRLRQRAHDYLRADLTHWLKNRNSRSQTEHCRDQANLSALEGRP